MVQAIKKEMDSIPDEDFDPNQLPGGYNCPECNKHMEIIDWSSFLSIIEHLEGHLGIR